MSQDSLPGEVVFFIFFSLMISIILSKILKKLHLSTMILLVIFGAILRLSSKYFHFISKTTTLLDNIDNHTLLMIFTPPLIFETASSLEWYTFKKQFFQILLLATSAIGISTFLTALTIHYVLSQSDFSFSFCLMLGAVLSATDHVSVVAQFKAMHVEHRFGTLLHGETLLNEATVLVLFKVFSNIHLGNSYEIQHTILEFFWLYIGGFILGILFGIFLIYVLRNLNDSIEEINICIVTSYLLFYIADNTALHVSGGISVVTLGLCMSAYGKTVLSPGSEKTMESVQTLLSRNIEALIFIMAGMLCAKELMYEKYIYVEDFISFAVLFCMLYVIRGVSITVHAPILKRYGYGMKWGEIVTMSFCGMKGAITIIFGLMAFHEPENTEREKAFLLCGCLEIAILSLIVDSFIVRKFVKLFQLENMSIVQENLMIQVTSSIVYKTYEIIEDLKENDSYKLSHWESVQKSSGAFSLVYKILISTSTGRKLLKLRKFPNDLELVNAYSEVVSLSPNQMLRETRRRFISSMKGTLWQLFEKGQCFRNTVLVMMRAMNRALDHDDESLNDWEYILDSVMPKFGIKIITKGANLIGVGKVFKGFLYDMIISAYDSATCFLAAHTEACSLLNSMEFQYDNEYLSQILNESSQETQKCLSFINTHVTSIYPEIISFVQTYKSSHYILHEQRKLIKHLYNHGLIGEIEFHKLLAVMNFNLKSLEGSYNPVVPDTLSMLTSIFPHISASELSLLQICSQEVMIGPDQYLYSLDGEWKGAFIILKGLVEERTENWRAEQVIGDISGVQHLIPSLHTNITSAKAITPVLAIRISLSNLEFAPNLEKHIWYKAAERILMIFKPQFGEHFVKLSNNLISEIVSKCEFGKYYIGEEVSVENGALLLKGRIGEYSAYSFIPPGEILLITLETDVILFHFPYAVRYRVSNFRESIGAAIYNMVYRDKHRTVRDTITPRNSRVGLSTRGVRFGPSQLSRFSNVSGRFDMERISNVSVIDSYERGDLKELKIWDEVKSKEPLLNGSIN